jgi:hypothetical protein
MADEHVQLAAGQLLVIGDGRSMIISVQQGTGIITQEREPDDAVAKPGAAFTVRQNGKTILVACTDMAVKLAASPHATRAGRVQIKSYTGPRATVVREVRFQDWPIDGSTADPSRE